MLACKRCHMCENGELRVNKGIAVHKLTLITFSHRHIMCYYVWDNKSQETHR